MNIYVTSGEIHLGAWRHQEERLRGLWAVSSRQHQLVDSPEEADLVLVGNIRDENWFLNFREHPVVRDFPEKCFALSDRDEPQPLLRGIYTSGHKKLWFRFRYRTGAYSLYHPDFKNPFIERYDGGAFDRPKNYLFSFSGRNCHQIRSRIFHAYSERTDCYIRDTSGFNLFTHENTGKTAQQKSFKEVLERSKFALCPRGNGASSIRLFEAMRMGVAPIILADDWILPTGPRWEEFALFVRERDVAKIEAVARQNESRYREMGRAAAVAYAQFFSDEAYFDYIVDQCAQIAATQMIPERLFWSLKNVIVLGWRVEGRLRRKFSRSWRALGSSKHAPQMEAAR